MAAGGERGQGQAPAYLLGAGPRGDIPGAGPGRGYILAGGGVGAGEGVGLKLRKISG